MRICLDIDDTVLNWTKAHETFFDCDITYLPNHIIAKQVESLRTNAEFWCNIEVLEYPDFQPICYCTKRINSNLFTVTSLQKNGLPLAPIYRLVQQSANKAKVLKGVADILIDDSWYNVQQCLKAGFPALLITRPSNKHIKTLYRVNHLRRAEIERKYHELFK